MWLKYEKFWNGWFLQHECVAVSSGNEDLWQQRRRGKSGAGRLEVWAGLLQGIVVLAGKSATGHRHGSGTGATSRYTLTLRHSSGRDLDQDT